jgi:hypothetical protein
MRNSILAAALVASAILGGIAGGGIATNQAANRDTQATQVFARIKAFEDFDYDKCNWIVASVSAAPANWKELTRTPGGNWCVTTER